MSPTLILTLTDYRDAKHWRWLLTDANGKFLADHEVALDSAAPEYRGFVDLPTYLRYDPSKPTTEALTQMGVWLGVHLFGGLAPALLSQLHRAGSCVIEVCIPKDADWLVSRPLELAHLDGQPCVALGVRFVYTSLPAAQIHSLAEKGSGPSLRILAVFSLPDIVNPLNLRRERYQLVQLVENLRSRGLAVDLRVLQYGATRQTLQAALEEDEGWDVLHFSGHGLRGELLLETETGADDLIDVADLTKLVRPTQARLQLLTLSACLSGAGTLPQVRAQLGLTEPASADRHLMLAPSALPMLTGTSTELPSLAQQLVQKLDCAALAMRYAVEDTFAIDLLLAFYQCLLDRGQSVPTALKQALDQAVGAGATGVGRRGALTFSPLSSFTPILFGKRAVALTFKPPRRLSKFELPRTGLFNFPTEPKHFVGRLLPMLRATRALAPYSDQRGVLFYGMAGAGKTTCALELVYRHDPRHDYGRFVGYVWHKAPDEGTDITTALGDFLRSIENQLSMQEEALSTFVDQPERFRQITLPRLRELVAQHAVLIVLDNVESLLTSIGEWRDALWGDLIQALFDGRSASRLLLTSRRLPNSLANQQELLREPIHALSFRESVVLARELPRMQHLFASAETRNLLALTLGVVHGHPKLLDLAEGAAADTARLAQLVSEAKASDAPDAMQIFFASDESQQKESDYVAKLQRWTAMLLATLPPVAHLNFTFLCQLEEEDRTSDIIEANWQNFLDRLVQSAPQFVPTVHIWPPITAMLVAAGLVESRSIVGEGQPTTFAIHPTIAKFGRTAADSDVLIAVDMELGNFWSATSHHGRETEMAGSTSLVVQSCLRGTPYLMRQARWKEASALLELVLHRDKSPVTMNTVLSRLHQIDEKTRSSNGEQPYAGILAHAMSLVGRRSEAETMLQCVITQAVTLGNYRQALAGASDLLNLLQEAGQFVEALALAEQMDVYISRAGLGRWTQLIIECQRLQILNSLGEHRTVLITVQQMRDELSKLPIQNAFEESVDIWNLQETILDVGSKAAMGLGEWKDALNLNNEILEIERERGADEFELASTRFNNYYLLLRLERNDEVRLLLEHCRVVFEQAQDVFRLGAIFSALAHLEDKEKNSTTGVRFEQVALRYFYQSGRPIECATSHNNLANYLQKNSAPSTIVLAHQLASGIIRYQTGSGLLSTTLSNLVDSMLPSILPTFDAVADTVEQIEGVNFRELCARLSIRVPDGNTAITAIWALVQTERTKQAAESDAKPAKTLEQFEPLLQSIAAVATGTVDAVTRAKLEAERSNLEQTGWRLVAIVLQRIWAGERDAAALVRGLDNNSAALIHRILALIGVDSKNE